MCHIHKNGTAYKLLHRQAVHFTHRTTETSSEIILEIYRKFLHDYLDSLSSFSQRTDLPLVTQKVSSYHLLKVIKDTTPINILLPLVVSRTQMLQLFASSSHCAHSFVIIRSTNSRAIVVYIILLGGGGRVTDRFRAVRVGVGVRMLR